MTTTDDDLPILQVQSDLLPSGAYATAIHFNGGRSRLLDPAEALAYAAGVARAAMTAEYDAAVVRQLTGMGLPLAAIATCIRDMRGQRPPPDPAATAPLTLIPGVGQVTRTAFVVVALGGREIGQWTPAEARAHAMNVLIVSAGADLDATYHRHLVDEIGLDPAAAAAMVCDLDPHFEARDA